MRNERPGSLQLRRKAWREKGFTTNIQVDAPGKTWPVHQHAVAEIVELKKGTIEMRIGARKHHLKPGMKVVVPPRMPHNIRNTGRADAVYFYGFRRKK